MRVELTTRKMANRLARRLKRGGATIGPVGGDGIQRVCYGKDARAQKNFFSFEAARIAAAVGALVMREDNLGDVRKKGDVLDEVEPDLYVPLHQSALVCSERTRLEQDAVGDSELSDIMQISATGKTSQLFVRPAQRAGNLEGVAANTLRMPCRFMVAEVDGRAKCLQRVFIAALDLLESRLELLSAFRDHFFKVLAIVFDLLFKLALVKGAFEAGHDGTFPERFDKIVVRATAHRLHAYVHVIHTGGDQERHVRMAPPDFRQEFHALMPGMCRSETTASNRSRCKAASASSPLQA